MGLSWTAPIGRIALVVAYLASVVVGVWAVDAIGVVPVGFGLMAPAAVYVVGVTLVLRDVVQIYHGKALAFAVIPAGAALSAFISPTLALASGVAFLVSETVDFAVFTLARKRLRVLQSVALSNAVALVVDSWIFLTLAFGSLAFLPGQVLGKTWATLAAVLVLWVIRRSTR